MRATVSSITAVLAALSGYASDTAPSLRIVAPETVEQPVRVTGVSADVLSRLQSLSQDAWAETFSVYVYSEEPVPPVLGTYRVDYDGVTFSPRLPFVAGQAYRVIFRSSGQQLETTFAIPNRSPPTATAVWQVFPTTSRLPENLLRIYIYFTAPMRGGDVYDAIGLLDSDGNEVKDAFVQTHPELWDPAMRRLTLICHPGRIKRGLRLHDEAGPPLIEGRSYSLQVGRMRDAADVPIETQVVKRFEVIPPDRLSPDPAGWEITPPAAGSTAPLRVNFREPLDHALLKRLMTVMAGDEPVLGQIVVSPGERSWAYHPDGPWAPGRYAVVVRRELEDLAGNRLDQRFDEERSPDARPAWPERIEIPFTVR